MWAMSKESRYERPLMGPSLDERIGADHGIRLLDEILQDVDWSPWEAIYACTHAGRPPIHPRLMAGAILYGLCKGLHSTRALEEATRMRLDFQWFLDGLLIDHTTFCVFRKRFGTQIQELFKQLNRQSAALKQVTLEELIIDGTRMRSNSDRHGARTADSLEARLVIVEQKIAEGLHQLGEEEDAIPEELSSEALQSRLHSLEEQRRKLQSALEVARERDEVKRQREGANSTPVRVPVTDPESSILPNKEGGYAPNYTPVVAVSPEGVILGTVIADGNAEAATVVELVDQVSDLHEESGPVKRVLADGGFASGENFAYMEQAGIEFYTPVVVSGSCAGPAASETASEPVPTKGGKLGREAFLYDAESNAYQCPEGRTLPLWRTTTRKSRSGVDVQVQEYRCLDCSDCPLAQRCLKGKAKRRMISRDAYEPCRERASARMATDEGQQIYRRRAPVVEGVIGRIKASMGVRQFRRRGKINVGIEWAWICTAFNLKKRIKGGAPSSPKKRTKKQYPAIYRAWKAILPFASQPNPCFACQPLEA